MPVSGVVHSGTLVPETIERCRPTNIRAKGKATAIAPTKAMAKQRARTWARIEALRGAVRAWQLSCPQTCKRPGRCVPVDVADHGSGLEFSNFSRVRGNDGSTLWQITAYAFELIHHDCRCRRE